LAIEPFRKDEIGNQCGEERSYENEPYLLPFKNPEEESHQDKSAQEIPQYGHNHGIGGKDKENENDSFPKLTHKKGLRFFLAQRGSYKKDERKNSEYARSTKGHKPHSRVLKFSNSQPDGFNKYGDGDQQPEKAGGLIKGSHYFLSGTF
jgi:hypothetical protein